MNPTRLWLYGADGDLPKPPSGSGRAILPRISEVLVCSGVPCRLIGNFTAVETTIRVNSGTSQHVRGALQMPITFHSVSSGIVLDYMEMSDVAQSVLVDTQLVRFGWRAGRQTVLPFMVPVSRCFNVRRGAPMATVARRDAVTAVSTDHHWICSLPRIMTRACAENSLCSCCVRPMPWRRPSSGFQPYVAIAGFALAETVVDEVRGGPLRCPFQDDRRPRT